MELPSSLELLSSHSPIITKKHKKDKENIGIREKESVRHYKELKDSIPRELYCKGSQTEILMATIDYIRTLRRTESILLKTMEDKIKKADKLPLYGEIHE